MNNENVLSSWGEVIKSDQNNPLLRSRTCHIYNRQSELTHKDSKERCPCGRLIRRHSLEGPCLQSEALQRGETWIPPEEFQDNKNHSCQVPVNVFGALTPRGCKFVRMDSRFNSVNLNELSHLYHLILKDCDGAKPGLIFSICGGAKYFTLTEQLQRETVRGIIDIAARVDAWIITAGIDTGMSKLVGEGISHYRLLHEYLNKIRCIGLTMWGTINENTRLSLKQSTKGYPKEQLHRQIPVEQQEDKDSVELNHTYCILFDSGRLNEYLSDSHRDRFIGVASNGNDPACYAVTIVFGGDLNNLEVFENDIQNKRPIVLIQGSGRLTDMFISLLDLTSNDTWNEHWNPTEREVRTAFDIYFPSYTDEEAVTSLKQIKGILEKTYRYLFTVYSFEHGKSLVQTIFNAILSAKKIGRKTENGMDIASDSPEVVRRVHERRLIDLAFNWNYIDGARPILQRWQDKMMNKKLHLIEKHSQRDNDLFKKCLENNRSTFVDFYLSAGFDPRELTRTKRDSECEQIIWELYEKSRQAMSESHRSRITTLFGRGSPCSKEQLHQKLLKFVGPFIGSLDNRSSKNVEERICMEFCTCLGCYRRWKEHTSDHFTFTNNAFHENDIEGEGDSIVEYTKDRMIRDLFIWSVLMDLPEMAKVLLIHVRSRLCAALFASSIFKQYAKAAATIYLKEKLHTQALDFETYAASCINQCYEYNERTACELLFREVPLFGYVTCMQLGIASESESLLETACFDQALNLVWYSRLALSNSQIVTKPSLCLSLGLLGLPAPLLINYRENERDLTTQGSGTFDLSPKGIDYYVNKESSGNWSWLKYYYRLQYFHQNPMVKMCYHFISYVWFLLAFSYMMLYHMDNRKVSKNHWTEIYVIVTVTTMLFEEVRETVDQYNTQMLERSVSPKSTVQMRMAQAFTALPYVLFYLGMGFRFGSGDNDDILTTARIILALDLEIWYLQSLKFVIALKFLGPKLFMLKNMLRDLFAFVYLIFVAIAAYGVVSRSLIFYRQVPFNPRGIFRFIFYAPYWFMYTVITDKDEVDMRIRNETSKVVAEATATQLLLSFHMLFINILMLNLLIAVFADTIGKVQRNTEFYWRYQRYSFVRQYFQRPIFAYPPLIIIPHILLLADAIKRKFCSHWSHNSVDDRDADVSPWKMSTSVLKMIPKTTSSLDEHWDMFEDAATYCYARLTLEQHKKEATSNNNQNSIHKTMVGSMSSDWHATNSANQMLTAIVDDQQTTAGIKEEFNTLKTSVTNMETSLEQIVTAQQTMMDFISRFDPDESQQPVTTPNLSSITTSKTKSDHSSLF